MLDIDLIRSDAPAVRRALARRGENAPIDQVLDLDTERRSIQHEADALRAHRNTVSKEIGRSKPPPEDLLAEMRTVSAKIKDLEAKTREVEQKIGQVQLGIPNIPREIVPDGTSEEDNVVVRSFGKKSNLPASPLPHWELGERLGILDLAGGARVSGSRFYSLRGKGAKLQRALISWMLDVHTSEHGYTELYLPYLVNTSGLELPKVVAGRCSLPWRLSFPSVFSA